jgi:hypothetical protein
MLGAPLTTGTELQPETSSASMAPHIKRAVFFIMGFSLWVVGLM